MHRLNNFDLIRIFAALCVLVSHQHALTGLAEPTVLHAETLGGLGVLVFFSISGFLVANSWVADPSPWRFAARRLLRIWPGLAVVITVTALVMGPVVSDLSIIAYFSHPLLTAYALNLVFALHDQLPLSFVGNALPHAINSSLWTIPLELQCYVALGLLGMAGLLRYRWVLAVLTSGLALLTYLVGEPMYRQHPELLHWRLEQVYLLHFGLYFFAGVSLSGLRLCVRPGLAVTALVVLWLLGGLALALGKPLLTLWLVVPVTVVVLGQASTPVLRHAGRFGDLSYGLYIYAFPVQQTLIWQFRDRMSWGALLALTIAITALLAFVSWHLVEKRALRLKPGNRPDCNRQVT